MYLTKMVKDRLHDRLSCARSKNFCARQKNRALELVDEELLFYFCMTLAISNIAFSIWWANRFEDVVGHVVFDDTYKIFENFFCKKNLWFQGISR